MDICLSNGYFPKEYIGSIIGYKLHFIDLSQDYVIVPYLI
jgi:hypothetical protein